MAQQTAAIDDRALGTSVRVVASPASQVDVAKSAVDAVLRDIDATCSRFRDDSEISRLHAGGEMQVSPLLAKAIGVALRGARLTDGAVDPTVGAAVRLAGYDRDFTQLPPDGEPLTLAAMQVPGWRAVQFDAARRTIVVPRGVELDLGATAKALAADLAATSAYDAMQRSGGVLVSLGGDVAIAGDAPDDGWVIQLSESSAAAFDPAAPTISLRTGAIASSSTTVRRWRRGGVELHHIIDPRTGLPAATPWRLVSVLAGTCVDANIAATAAIVHGARAVEWLDAHSVAARLCSEQGEVVCTTAWPDAPSAPS